MSLRSDVVALYVDPRGPYPELLADGHWYDESRDARTYAGPWPVVAHPPCGPWGTLRTLSRETTRELALVAIEQVRRWGGVLEHPSTSGLFGTELPHPWEMFDPWGGVTIQVDQCDWGHPARKRTNLYLVGITGHVEYPPHREPTHWCSGVHTPGARGKPPAGIKICSAQQRRRTPVAFAEWLLALAARAARSKVD